MEITIELDKLVEKKNVMAGELYSRDKIHQVFEEEIKPLLASLKDSSVVCVDMTGIKSMTVSVIIKLFLQDIKGFCKNFENVVVVVTNIEKEAYQELMYDFEAAILLAEKVAKNDKDTIPYLLIEHEGKMRILGFEFNEEQNRLFQYLNNSGQKITSAELAEKENISLSTASNRLIRLYEKGLICREMVGVRQYQYYSILKREDGLLNF